MMSKRAEMGLVKNTVASPLEKSIARRKFSSIIGPKRNKTQDQQRGFTAKLIEDISQQGKSGHEHDVVLVVVNGIDAHRQIAKIAGKRKR